MPPKSSNKKSGNKSAAIWYYCETCDVHITAQERERHETICPIRAEQLDTATGDALEYVRKGTLFTASLELRKFELEALKEMPTKHLNNLVFISEGAMRLAGWHIGQLVSIQGAKDKAGELFIRTIWPTPDKFLTTVFATEEDYNANFLPLKGLDLRIDTLPKGQPFIAKTVVLQIQTHNSNDTLYEPLNAQQQRDLERLLKAELKSLCFTLGSIIRFNFFNRDVILKIIDWINEKQGEYQLEQSFKELSLDKREYRDIFKVVLSTKVEVENSCNENDKIDNTIVKLITKKDIGGLAKQMEIIDEAMDFALNLQEAPKGVKISRGLLLFGPSGCGKSMICQAMTSKLIQHQQQQQQSQTTRSKFKPLILKLNSSEIFSKFLGETEKNLLAQFDKVYRHYPQPSLVIIEDVHNLCPKHENNEIVKRVAIAFFSILDNLASKREAQKCFILATTANLDMLNPSIRRCGRLDYEVEVSAPTPDGRREILECLLRKVENHSLQREHIEEIAQITHGFVGADLANLIYNATLNAIKTRMETDGGILNFEDLNSALVHVKPSAMREVLIECPNVLWSDIGGQDELKLKLQQAIEWPLKHAQHFKRMGIKPPRGLLMYGPPGCSKTMIAKALATESKLNFLSIKGPELFSMWVGESERAVREVFRKARQVAPAIAFFDEIDAIGGERSEGSAGGSGSSVKERVLTQLLTEMDGVESLENVTIVAATNRPDMIDKALLRPGRIDRIIYVRLPNAEARRDIFRIKLKKMPLSQDVNIDKLVANTEGYSGAEIQAVCTEAALKTLEESFDSEAVGWQQFEYALKAVQPRTSPELLQLYEEYGKKT